MTQKDFETEYDKLAETFPFEFKNGFREKAIFQHVKDLELSWWTSLVNRILVSGNAKLDIEQAALGERRRLAEGRKTKEQLDAMNLLYASGDGLSQLLKEHGVGSIGELIGRNLNKVEWWKK